MEKNRKHSKKKKSQESHNENKPVSNEPKPEPAIEEKPFDFGGLPDRDLKKNLGCG